MTSRLEGVCDKAIYRSTASRNQAYPLQQAAIRISKSMKKVYQADDPKGTSVTEVPLNDWVKQASNIAPLLDFSAPDYLDDIPPPVAAQHEGTRQRALAWLFAHDYQLVVPPLVEHLQTLTAGDDDLDQQTFKITDTVSGRTLGIRADQTPQIARFDAASHPPANSIRRYCYCGPVLCTRPLQPWLSRESMQLGAELFGASTPAADWEIINVALGTLKAIGLTDICLDIGQANLFYRLVEDSAAEVQKELMRHVCRRDVAAIRASVVSGSISSTVGDWLNLLAQTDGDVESVKSACRHLPAQRVGQIIDDLIYVAHQLETDGYDVNINLSDLGSYGYHTGTVFTLYVGKDIAGHGGRYQHPVTGEAGVGFSLDLYTVSTVIDGAMDESIIAIPMAIDDKAWRSAVAGLRQQKRPLRFVYEGEALTPPRLIKKNDTWVICEK